MHVWVGETQRIPPQSVNSTIKNYHWLDFTTALFQSYDQGAESTILTDNSNNITEGPGFNIFLVINDALWTPRGSVLHGITRDTVITLTQEKNRVVNLVDIQKRSLFNASEIFGTSTAGGIFPIVKVNDVAIGDGKPGPVTASIAQQYWREHEMDRWTESI